MAGARYTDDAKERVREAADMAEVVGARTELRRAGAGRYMGLCPFHEERTPSFSVDADRKLYHCFGCGAAGDIFTFVRETEALDFSSALEQLADRYGVALERESEDPRAAARRQRRERLYAVLERASAYYERVLWEAPEAARAREYLAERGLGEEVLRAFRVGWAPSPWDRVTVASRRAGFSEEELLAAGLASRSRQGSGIYDRFRARITFPLSDKRGRVIGFGARTLSSVADSGPKYLNSPEGELYSKGRQLFGLHLARRPAATSQSLLVAEGYTDVLMLHQAGIENAVGLMGTALTEDQVRELVSAVGAGGTIDLALDADASGQEAMVRAAEMTRGRDVTLRVVPLPQGLDPADLVARDGAEGMGKLVADAVPFARFRVDHILRAGELGTPEGRDRALADLRPVVAAVGQGITRDELVRTIASRLSMTPALVAQSLAAQRLPRSFAGSERPRPARVGSPPTGSGERRDEPAPTPAMRAVLERRERTERNFLALCIALPEQGREALRRVTPEEHFGSPEVRRAAEHLRRHLTAPLDGLPPEDEALARLMAELTVRAGQEAGDADMLEVELLQLEKDRLERQIAEGGPVAALAEARSKVKSRLDEAVERAMARTTQRED